MIKAMPNGNKPPSRSLVDADAKNTHAQPESARHRHHDTQDDEREDTRKYDAAVAAVPTDEMID